MNNLFVCHTQANLLLACGLVKKRFVNDDNFLIVFVDFILKEDVKKNLIKTFTQVLFLTGTFPATNKKWGKKIQRYPHDLKLIKQFCNKKIDRLFEVCDEAIPELYILKKLYHENSQLDAIWLEDGSYPYFQNTINRTGLKKNNFLIQLRKFVFRNILGYGKCYDFRGDFMGSNYLLRKAYLTFPKDYRKEYDKKEIIPITDEEFFIGLQTLYPSQEQFSLKNNSALLVLDKLDVYSDIDKIKSIVKEIKERYHPLYYKYHPREESKLDELSDCEELDRAVGVEFFYSASYGKKVTVIGIKSTSLQNAIKMGFNTISYAKQADECSNDILTFYKNIGIKIY